MLYHVTIDGRTFRVEIDGGRVLLDGEDACATAIEPVPGTPIRHLLMDGR